MTEVSDEMVTIFLRSFFDVGAGGKRYYAQSLRDKVKRSLETALGIEPEPVKHKRLSPWGVNSRETSCPGEII